MKKKNLVIIIIVALVAIIGIYVLLRITALRVKMKLA